MQNRYVGDIGDYIKLSLLRELCAGRRLGVAWWLVRDEGHNKDGRHINYLSNEAHWRSFDPITFDSLRTIVLNRQRSVMALEESGVLPSDTEYVASHVPCPPKWTERAAAREIWFGELCKKLDNSTMIFLDPDNGIESARYSVTRKRANKSVRLNEIMSLRQSGRTLIVYHHHTRMRGGHFNELHHYAEKLRCLGATRVDALRAKAYSPRAFFIIDGDEVIQKRVEAFAARWEPYVSWHQNLGE